MIAFSATRSRKFTGAPGGGNLPEQSVIVGVGPRTEEGLLRGLGAGVIRTLV
jgi:hypothetical protein